LKESKAAVQPFYELICTYLFAAQLFFSAEMFFCFCLINKRAAPIPLPDQIMWFAPWRGVFGGWDREFLSGR
jgi:hypothetical protein